MIAEARATRSDAVRLRLEARELAFASRRRVRTAQALQASASAKREALAATLPSPWSELAWRYPDEALGQTLGSIG